MRLRFERANTMGRSAACIVLLIGSLVSNAQHARMHRVQTGTGSLAGLLPLLLLRCSWPDRSLVVLLSTGITVGLKLYKRAMLNDMERHQIAREIWLHIQLDHPSIIALFAAWKDKDHIYLVLEWAPEVGPQQLELLLVRPCQLPDLALHMCIDRLPCRATCSPSHRAEAGACRRVWRCPWCWSPP
jgi:hypothetical protein